MGVSLIKIPFLADQKFVFLENLYQSKIWILGIKMVKMKMGVRWQNFELFPLNIILFFRMIPIQMIIINLPVWLSHPILKSFKLRTLRISCFHKCYYEAKVLVLSRSTPYVTNFHLKLKVKKSFDGPLTTFYTQNHPKSLTLKISPFSLLIIMISCSGLCVSYSQP